MKRKNTGKIAKIVEEASSDSEDAEEEQSSEGEEEVSEVEAVEEDSDVEAAEEGSDVEAEDSDVEAEDDSDVEAEEDSDVEAEEDSDENAETSAKNEDSDEESGLDLAASATDSDEDDDEMDDNQTENQDKIPEKSKAERIREELLQKYQDRQGKQLYIRFPHKIAETDEALEKEVKELTPLAIKVHKPRQKHARFCLVDFETNDDRNIAFKQLKKAFSKGDLAKHVVNIPKTESQELVSELAERKIKSIENKRAKKRLQRASKKALKDNTFTSTVILLNLPKTATAVEIRELFPNAVDIQIKAGKGKMNKDKSIAAVNLPTTMDARNAIKSKHSLGGNQLIIKFDNQKMGRNKKRKLDGIEIKDATPKGSTPKVSTPKVAAPKKATAEGVNADDSEPSAKRAKLEPSAEISNNASANPDFKGKPNNKKPFSNDKKPFTKGKPFNKNTKPFIKGDKPFNRGNKPFDKGSKPFDKGNKNFGKVNKPFNRGNKPPFNKGNKPFNKDKKPFNRDNKPFNRDNKPHFNKPNSGGGNPFNKDRKPFNKGQQNSFKNKKPQISN